MCSPSPSPPIALLHHLNESIFARQPIHTFCWTNFVLASNNPGVRSFFPLRWVCLFVVCCRLSPCRTRAAYARRCTLTLVTIGKLALAVCAELDPRTWHGHIMQLLYCLDGLWLMATYGTVTAITTTATTNAASMSTCLIVPTYCNIHNLFCIVCPLTDESNYVHVVSPSLQPR